MFFIFYKDESIQDWDQQVVVYTCHDWTGEPTESEEVAPRCFERSDLPLERIWNDDKYWLPRILAGALIGTFRFDFYGSVLDHDLRAF